MGVILSWEALLGGSRTRGTVVLPRRGAAFLPGSRHRRCPRSTNGSAAPVAPNRQADEPPSSACLERAIRKPRKRCKEQHENMKEKEPSKEQEIDKEMSIRRYEKDMKT